MKSDENVSKEYLGEIIKGYCEISEQSLSELEKICRLKFALKGECLEKAGTIPRSFYFIYQGLVRSYTLSKEGKEITKIFFDKGGFPGNIVSLLQNEESIFFIQALEDTAYLELDYKQYRKLIYENIEIARFHIAYIERHWIIEKEPQDISLRSEEAYERYLKFTENYPNLINRISLGQIASYLGITQTQLSRIRKKS